GPQGMGLGLSIVRRACVKLGHPVEVAPRPHGGTVFRVGLMPVSPGAARQDFQQVALQGLRARVALIVENDAAMRRGYELMVGDRVGVVVGPAGGIAEALAVMGQDDPPDVILADYNLDNGDTGIGAIEALRLAAGQHIPAVMVTAQRGPGPGRASAELG